MIRAVLFDNFGVVASVDYWSRVEQIEEANGRSAKLQDYIETMNLGTITWTKFCESVAKDLRVDVNEVERRYSKYSLNRQIIAFARRLKENYTVALASNAHHDYIRRLLTDTSLDMLFDPIFVSSEMGFVKPDPRFYEHITSVLNLHSEECVLIDDSPGNIAGAIEAGMHGVLFENTAQAIKAVDDLLDS